MRQGTRSKANLYRAQGMAASNQRAQLSALATAILYRAPHRMAMVYQLSQQPAEVILYRALGMAAGNQLSQASVSATAILNRAPLAMAMGNQLLQQSAANARRRELE